PFFSCKANRFRNEGFGCPPCEIGTTSSRCDCGPRGRNPDFGCPPRQIGRACRYQRDPEFGGPHFADLQRHTETTATQIAGTQAQSLDENERIAARLIGLEQKLAPLGDQQQNLSALGDQLSSIKQTIDGATLREQENIAALSDQQQSLTALTDQLSS